MKSLKMKDILYQCPVDKADLQYCRIAGCLSVANCKVVLITFTPLCTFELYWGSYIMLAP